MITNVKTINAEHEMKWQKAWEIFVPFTSAVELMLQMAIFIAAHRTLIHNAIYPSNTLGFIFFFRKWNILRTATLWIPIFNISHCFCLNFKHSQPYVTYQNSLRHIIKTCWFILHGVILWCSAINYHYTTIINNFLNENDSVDLRCILIIRVKHNYTAALSWHVDSFRVQFCFNTLIM